MRGKKYKYIPDYTANNAMAGRARDLWSRYQSAYLPVTEELVGKVGEHPEEIERAGITAGDYADRATADAARTIAQYGIQLSPLQRPALMTKLSSNKALGQVMARGGQREIIDDRNEWLTENLINAGVGIRNASNTALGSAQSLEDQRNQTGYGIAGAKTAQSQAKVAGWQQLAGQAIGTGAMLYAMS
jgi:hypothetical protein